MTIVSDIDSGWEWFECLWIGKFWNESIRIDVKFFLFDSWTQIQIQTSLESLLNQSVIKWNVSHFIKSSRNEIKWSVFFIHFFPFFLFLFIEKEFLWWVVRLIVSG